MPYLIAEDPPQSGRFYVFKQGQDGKTVGDGLNKKPYPSHKAAEPYLRALYAATKKKEEATAELDVTVLGPSGAGLEQVLSQADVQYTEQSPYVDKRCSLCVFFAAAGSCYIVAPTPEPILPQGYCDEFISLDVLRPVGGSYFQMPDLDGNPQVAHEMSTDLPIAKGDPGWDAGAARERIWAWATDDAGHFDEAKAAQAFLIHDGESKGGLKDPIADVVDGHLEVIPAALRAASSRLPQTDASGKSGAASVLAHYKKKAGIGEGATAEMIDYNTTRFPEIPSLICEIWDSQLKGSYPDISFAPGVDLESIKELDPDPFFLTLPIAEVGVVSANKLRYTEDLCRSLAEQINSDKPTGIRGHIKEADRPTAYPNPEIYWLGAEFISSNAANPSWGNKTWAKAYIPPGETRNEYKVKKAVNAVAATSIYGKPLQIQEYKDGTYTPTLKLEHVDLAPPKRAATGKAYPFMVTSEIEQPAPASVPAQIADSFVQPTGQAEPNPETENEDTEDMTPEDIHAMSEDALCEMLGPETVQKIANRLMAQSKMKMVAAEMETVPASMISEMQAQTAVIAELQAYKQGAQQREVAAALDQAVGGYLPYRSQDDHQKAVLAETRAVLFGDAARALGASLDPALIVETVKQVVEAHPALMEMTRNTMLGPSVFMAREDNRQVSDARYYNGVDVNDPAVQQAARIKYGI